MPNAITLNKDDCVLFKQYFPTDISINRHFSMS